MRPSPTETPEAGGWQLIDLVAALCCLGALEGIQLVAARSGFRSSGMSLTLFLYFPTILTASLVVLLGMRRGLRLSDLGFVRPRTWRPGLRAYAAALVAGPAYGYLVLSLGTVVHPLTPGVILGAMAPVAPSAVALWAFPLVVTVPLFEEI